VGPDAWVGLVTLRDLERSVYRRLSKHDSVPNAATQARIRGFLNERHRDILTDYPHLRDAALTFASVASTQQYALPEHGVAEILRIWDPTNRIRLEQRGDDWLRREDPEPVTGTPTAWIPQSYTQVHTQPSNASEVFVDSTSASDVNRCYIEGITTGGYRRKAEVTMTGTTAVSLDATITTWIQIDKFYLSEEAVGTVTLHEDASGGTELSKIAIGDTHAKYLSFLLWPTPSAIITYSARIRRAIADMVHPLDEPLLPIDFHQMLAVGARLDEYEHSDDSRRPLAETEWDRWEKKLTAHLVAHPDRRLSLNHEPVPEGVRSSLGAWFPAGS
jgi:hypothetical protein